eukprot:TRINITY_DN763_c0_g2_i1.p1 TRINITY_DN763_c0_g2~~TRINITY_DN763_c0_g2_i1.p1  ORF type:complete len:456 (+),score=142.90 TRINITY_DN763_c0_g2_i1:68-1369(+)
MGVVDFLKDPLDYQRWSHIPWKVYNPEAVDKLPTFVLGEFLFFGVVLIALIHALQCTGEERKKHLLLFAVSSVGGLANDVVFMTLPIVNNFWHGAAMFMINPRFPAYILAVYLAFLYFPNAVAWRLGLPPVAQACVSAILASAFYSPFDVVGPQFLWWTWHDTDNTTLYRMIGVPVASTTWLITFNFCYAYVLRKYLPDKVDFANGARCLFWTCVISVPFMMTFMAIVACIVGYQDLKPMKMGEPWGPPANNIPMHIFTTGLFVFPALLGISQRDRGTASRNAPSGMLWAAVVVYFGTLAWIMINGVAEEHVSTGLHQQYGPCGVDATDYTGANRSLYICKRDYVEEFRFDGCGPGSLPKGGFEPSPSRDGYDPTAMKWQWYTICGKAPSAGWRAQGLGVAGVSFLTYAIFLLAAREELPPHRAFRGSSVKQD